MIFALSRESWNNSPEGSVKGPILLTGALNWKSADNLSVNISYFKADHLSRNIRLMSLFVILNLHLLYGRSWGEEEKQQRLSKVAELRKVLPFLTLLHTVTSAPAQNGEQRGWWSPRLEKFSLVAKSHSSPYQPAKDLCSEILSCRKFPDW